MKKYLMCGLLMFISIQTQEEINNKIYEIDNDKIKWNILIKSMIQVESEGNDLITSGNSLGCLQITPIYVKEVNNILGYKKYSLEDRKSRSKSIEMFNIIQHKNNPKHNISKAIKLHNPGASQKYENKIRKWIKHFSNL